MQIRLSSSQFTLCLSYFRLSCGYKWMNSWLGILEHLRIIESWSHVVDISELQWVGMLKHLLELNACITLLPMRKMLIIKMLVLKWLNMSDVLSGSSLLALCFDLHSSCALFASSCASIPVTVYFWLLAMVSAYALQLCLLWTFRSSDFDYISTLALP